MKKPCRPTLHLEIRNLRPEIQKSLRVVFGRGLPETIHMGLNDQFVLFGAVSLAESRSILRGSMHAISMGCLLSYAGCYVPSARLKGVS